MLGFVTIAGWLGLQWCLGSSLGVEGVKLPTHDVFVLLLALFDAQVHLNTRTCRDLRRAITVLLACMQACNSSVGYG